jgi:hypothetical protein
MGHGMVLRMQVYVLHIRRFIEYHWSLNLGTCGMYEKGYIQFFSCAIDLMKSSELRLKYLAIQDTKRLVTSD